MDAAQRADSHYPVSTMGTVAPARQSIYDVRWYRAAQSKSMQFAVLVPLTFPAPTDVHDPASALDVPLASLQHWEQVPSNPMLLQHRAGVPVAVTSARLRDAGREFWPRLRQAVQRGRPADAALAALTTQPAGMRGESARPGTVEAGRAAHVVMTRCDPFVDDDAGIEMVFVHGRPVRSGRADALERGDPRGAIVTFLSELVVVAAASS